MIEVKEKGGKTTVTSSNRPPSIYLDHWAIREISSNTTFKARFLSTFKTKGTLLFSLVNAIEISRNRGQSLNEIQAFLEQIGEHWFPIEINPIKVINAERQYIPGGNTPNFADNFLNAYYPYIHNGPLSLSTIVDLVKDGNSNDPLFSVTVKTFDEMVQSFRPARDRWNSTADVRKTAYQPKIFNPDHPTQFVYDGLMLLMLKEKFNIDKNQVLDFLHATVSLAYADIVLLDKLWKNLADKLKIPRVIKIFSQSHLEQFLQSFEEFVIPPEIN